MIAVQQVSKWTGSRVDGDSLINWCFPRISLLPSSLSLFIGLTVVTWTGKNGGRTSTERGLSEAIRSPCQHWSFLGRHMLKATHVTLAVLDAFGISQDHFYWPMTHMIFPAATDSQKLHIYIYRLIVCLFLFFEILIFF